MTEISKTTGRCAIVVERDRVGDCSQRVGVGRRVSWSRCEPATTPVVSAIAAAGAEVEEKLKAAAAALVEHPHLQERRRADAE